MNPTALQVASDLARLTPAAARIYACLVTDWLAAGDTTHDLQLSHLLAITGCTHGRTVRRALRELCEQGLVATQQTGEHTVTVRVVTARIPPPPLARAHATDHRTRSKHQPPNQSTPREKPPLPDLEAAVTHVMRALSPEEQLEFNSQLRRPRPDIGRFIATAPDDVRATLDAWIAAIAPRPRSSRHVTAAIDQQQRTPTPTLPELRLARECERRWDLDDLRRRQLLAYALWMYRHARCLRPEPGTAARLAVIVRLIRDDRLCRPRGMRDEALSPLMRRAYELPMRAVA